MRYPPQTLMRPGFRLISNSGRANRLIVRYVYNNVCTAPLALEIFSPISVLTKLSMPDLPAEWKYLPPINKGGLTLTPRVSPVMVRSYTGQTCRRD